MIVLYIILFVLAAIIVACGFIFFVFWLKACHILNKKNITTTFQEASSRDTFVHISNVSPVLIRTLIYSEDVEFPFHKGYSKKQIIRSIRQNIKRRQRVFGASTITQQLVKNVFLYSKKTYSRKIVELIIACKVERTLSKTDILCWYLSILNFENGLIGLKSFASHYFSQNINEINFFNAIVVVATLTSPSCSLPGRDKEEFSFLRCLGRLRYNKYFEEIDLDFVQNKQTLLEHPELNDKYCKIASEYVKKYF